MVYRNSFLLSGLINKRSRLRGELLATPKVCRELKRDIAAIDRALKVCGYEGNPADLPSIRPTKTPAPKKKARGIKKKTG